MSWLAGSGREETILNCSYLVSKQESTLWLSLVVLVSYLPFMIFVALFCPVILMEYRVDLRQQVLCISMGDVKQTSLDVMVTCVRFRSDVIRMKALCNHPKSNLGSRPTLIRPQKSTFERFYPAGQCSLFQINFCAI